jgi:hypothetical protein
VQAAVRNRESASGARGSRGAWGDMMAPLSRAASPMRRRRRRTRKSMSLCRNRGPRRPAHIADLRQLVATERPRGLQPVLPAAPPPYSPPRPARTPEDRPNAHPLPARRPHRPGGLSLRRGDCRVARLPRRPGAGSRAVAGPGRVRPRDGHRHRLAHQAARRRARPAGADHQPRGHPRLGRLDRRRAAQDRERHDRPAHRRRQHHRQHLGPARLQRRQPARHRRVGHAGAAERPAHGELRLARRQRRRGLEQHPRRGDRTRRGAQGWRLGHLRHRRHRRRDQLHHAHRLRGDRRRRVLLHHRPGRRRQADGDPERGLRQPRRRSLQRVRRARLPAARCAAFGPARLHPRAPARRAPAGTDVEQHLPRQRGPAERRPAQRADLGRAAAGRHHQQPLQPERAHGLQSARHRGRGPRARRPQRLQLRLHARHRDLPGVHAPELPGSRHRAGRRRAPRLLRGPVRRDGQRLRAEPGAAAHPQPAGEHPAGALSHGALRARPARDAERHPPAHGRGRQPHQRGDERGDAPGARPRGPPRRVGIRHGRGPRGQQRRGQVHQRLHAVRRVRRRHRERRHQSVRGVLAGRPGPDPQPARAATRPGSPRAPPPPSTRASPAR